MLQKYAQFSSLYIMEDIEQMDLTAEEEQLLELDPEIPDHQEEAFYQVDGDWYAVAAHNLAAHLQTHGLDGIDALGYQDEDGIYHVHDNGPDEEPPGSPEYTDVTDLYEVSQEHQDLYHALWLSRVRHLDHQPETNKPMRTYHYVYGMHVPLEDFAE